jgi:hypothetical protein
MLIAQVLKAAEGAEGVMSKWSYSLALLLLYLATFALWLNFPTRWMYAGGGAVTTLAMAWLITRAALRGYFAGKVDLILHAVVAVDILSEGFLYEFCRVVFGVGTQLSVLIAVHGDFRCIDCAARLALVVGAHRAFALWRRAKAATGANAGALPVHVPGSEAADPAQHQLAAIGGRQMNVPHLVACANNGVSNGS